VATNRTDRAGSFNVDGLPVPLVTCPLKLRCMVERFEPQLGESWAYRARQVDDVVAVEVMKLGTQRPARVLVRFVDERFEGRQKWVPPARRTCTRVSVVCAVQTGHAACNRTC
jgi:hypothetical protein